MWSDETVNWFVMNDLCIHSPKSGDAGDLFMSGWLGVCLLFLIIPMFVGCVSYRRMVMGPVLFFLVMVGILVTGALTIFIGSYSLVGFACGISTFLTYGLNFGNWLWLQQLVAVIGIYLLAKLGAHSHNAHLKTKEGQNNDR